MNSIIESLNAWGARLLELAPTMLWQSSLLIAIVFAIDFAFRRKLRAAIRYALWLVVLVKLILPPTLALPTGAAWWLRSRPVVTTQPVAHPIRVTYANSIMPESDPEPAPAIPAPPPPTPHLTTSGWMLLASASVSVLLFAWLIFRWVQIARMVRRALPASQAINDLVPEIKPRKRLSRAVRVRITTDPISPAVCGLFRPVVLLPQSLVDKLDPEQLRAVLLHELIHLRRLDIWINFAQSLLQITYWWHPLLWLANARIRRVREEAVDDAVMLALREDSEVYAPTLLEVAKLEFNRPLASLGLVGILESKNALRQRIERLLSNTPRRAGLSIVSILGIAAFTAVAVPMAEGPARIVDAGAGLDLANSSNLIPYSAKVDPEVFIRNIKARASETMHTTNDFWGDILLSILDGYGINCTPPRAIGLNNKTGEITTQNSPEALQTLDQVIKELNLPGGERILNPPYGLKQVLIEAQIYQMHASDLAKLNLDSNHHSYHQANESPWWDIVESNDIGQITAKLKEMGIQPISRPRIQTSHGIAASLFVGDNTNNIELDCRPMIQDGSVDLTVLARTTGSYAPKGGWPDFAGWTNCAIFSRIGVMDGCGAILESKHPGNASDSKLVILLSAKILKGTAGTSRNASARSGATTGQTTAPSVSAAQLVQDGKLLYRLGKMDEAEVKLKEALAVDSENQAAWYYLSLIKQTRAKIKVEATNTFGGIQNLPNARLPRTQNFVETGSVHTSPARQEIYSKLNKIIFDKVSYSESPLSEVVQGLADQSQKRDPDNKGIPFLINKTDPTHTNNIALGDVRISVDPGLKNVRLMDVLETIVKTADHPIKYTVMDYGIEFSFRGPVVPELFTRLFKIDPNTVLTHLGIPTPADTNQTTLRSLQSDFYRSFTNAGFNLEPPRSVFFDYRKGTVVFHTELDQLDGIERWLSELNQPDQSEIPSSTTTVSPQGRDAAALSTKIYTINDGRILTHLGLLIPLNRNDESSIQRAVLKAFDQAGHDLPAPKNVAFDFRTGTVVVSATPRYLSAIDRAFAAATILQEPQRTEVSVKARFVEINAIRNSAGKIQAIDSDFTGALRKFLGANTKPDTNQSDVLTGILTESQMKDVLKVLQKSRHANLLNEGEVTTLSDRQAQFQIVDVMTVVSGLNVGIKNNPALSENETNFNYITTNMQFGATLDVIPIVSKDKSLVAMTLIPKVTEFLGYQKPDELSDYDKNLKRTQFPMPHWRERRMSTAVTVPDRHTVVLGGLSDDMISGHLDGTTSRKEYSNPPYRTYKQLLVFVTATIIDTAGNPATTVTKNSLEYPLHSENYYDSPVWGGFGGGGGGFGGGAPMLR